MKNESPSPDAVSLSRRSFVKLAGATAAGALLPRMSFAGAAAPAPTFPQGFLWAAASAAAQVESREGRGTSNWDVFADKKGHIADGSTNAVTTDFNRHYAGDLKLLADAGVNGFRFSFAWPRIQPEGPGKPSAEGLAFYDRAIDEMLRLGIRPMATMFHWDSPVWAGDLRDREITKRMADYAAILTQKFGDRVPLWLALNEPNSVATGGYALAMHAPGLASREAAGAAVHHQGVAQGLMIAAARANLPKGAKVGTTINLAPGHAMSDQPADQEAARLFDDYWNLAWLNPLYGKGYPESVRPLVDPFVQDDDMATIAAKPDFLGVNYYSGVYVKANAASPLGYEPVLGYAPEGFAKTQYFPVDPAGLTESLVRVHRDYGGPEIYVTETGFALDDPQPENGVVDDPKRIEYLRSYLVAAKKAMDEGVKLKGLTYWSAVDNWEWAEGFSKTFGLIQLDRATMVRTPKRSLAYYGQCSKQNGIAPVPA